MNSYLAHHGIKGQRWGIRRYQNEDGSLTAEGREHYGYGDGRKPSMDIYNASNKTKKKFALTEKQKKYLKIGVAVAGTALAAYGAYKFFEMADPTKSPFYDKATGMLMKPKLPGPLSKLTDAAADTRAVNPFGWNPNDPAQEGYFNNCTKCAMTYDLRRRGYNVRACQGFGMTSEGIKRCYPDTVDTIIHTDKLPDVLRNIPDNQRNTMSAMNKASYLGDMLYSRDERMYKQLQKENAQRILQTCQSMGPNARGHVGIFTTGGGHSIAFENDEKGITTFVDSQMANVIGTKGARAREGSEYFRQVLENNEPYAPTYINRFDDISPNIEGMKDSVFENADPTFERTIAAGVAAVGATMSKLSIDSIKKSKKKQSGSRR